MLNCKICKECNKNLPNSEFHRNNKNLDGKQSFCKSCSHIKRKIYYKTNKNKEYEALKKWRENNPEKTQASRKRWRENNPEKYEYLWRKHNKERKLKVLFKVGNGDLKCENCGCDKIEFLEINHKNGGGAKETKRNNQKFYSAILSGTRNIDDLNVLCKPCNNLHYLELKFGKQPFVIKWLNKDEQNG